MAAGETIEDLVKEAGGYTDNAYPFGAIYQNNDAKIINKKTYELLYDEFLDNIIALSQLNIGQNFDLTPTKLTEDIKNTTPSGRVVVDLLNEGSSSSVTIMDQDSLVIPEKTNSVYVYGEVSSEGAVSSKKSRRRIFRWKIRWLQRFADNELIYILHPNGETERYSKKRNLFASQPQELNMYQDQLYLRKLITLQLEELQLKPMFQY